MNIPIFCGYLCGAVWISAILLSCPPAWAGSTHPYYLRQLPTPQHPGDFDSDGGHIDLKKAHLPPYPQGNAVAQANSLFDARAASAIMDGANPKQILAALKNSSSQFPGLANGGLEGLQDALLEPKDYYRMDRFYTLRSRALAVMAYRDYFPSDNTKLEAGILDLDQSPAFYGIYPIIRNAPGHAGESLLDYLRDLVNSAILVASPGYCGTFGPGVDAATDLTGDFPEGNYDMTEMHLLHLVYCYYDELVPAAQDRLINQLLAYGRIHRPREDDIFTAGGAPDDWSRAGFVSPAGDHQDIDETENHILMIQTAKYLTNQLLYQQDHLPSHDNRRNGSDERPHCRDLLLSLLRNYLRDDFSEYNAKNYQEETRWALLNLCSYAYDHEVRLAARMVLDYISANIAVSSSDVRRMVPFRRLDQGANVKQLPIPVDLPRLPGGFMDVSLLDGPQGADPMAPYFALQTGNTRAYESANWSIFYNGGTEVTMEVVSNYRLPPSIHDLFVNDLHRRFFQRLHRTPRDEVGGHHNADNMEIYAGSPSYLITAGGEPARQAINWGPYFLGKKLKETGVAVSTSFMPTGLSGGPNTQANARDLIQFSGFSDFARDVSGDQEGAANYGVGPDFACGYGWHLPSWVNPDLNDVAGPFVFLNKRSGSLPIAGDPNRVELAGFYLALYENEEHFVVLEAFDTWLHPELTFDQFKSHVLSRNPNFKLQSNVEAQYTTENGNVLHFVIWNHAEREKAQVGARVLHIDYSPHSDKRDDQDSMGDAGNVTDRFLNGTVLNSPAEAVVEITNPFLGTKITLDMSDQWHPKRIAEDGTVEVAGYYNEVWVDFDWQGPTEGDFFHPFNSLMAAAAAVADGGVVKVMPGTSHEQRISIPNKRFKVIAPIGDVHLLGP